jgi:O-antigen ligase
LVGLALTVVFMPNLIDAYVLPRASIVIVGACIGTGLALLATSTPRLARLKWPLVAAAAAAVAAFAFSVSWPLSLAGGYTRYESLPIRLSYLGLLAVPVWLIRTERARTFVMAAVVLGVAASSVEAVTQWWQHLPFRPDGNLGNANLLGAVIAMALPLAVAGCLRLEWSLPFWLPAGAAMIAGLLASSSRSGALAALAGCLALIVFALRGRAAVVAGVLATAAVIGGLLLILFSPLRLLNGDPGPARLHLYPDALHMVAARPLTGWGEDATGLVFGRFLSGDWSSGVTFDRAHSGLLDLGATQGVLGLVTLGAVVFVLFQGSWRFRLPPSAPPRRGPSPASAIGAACVGYTVWVLFNFDWAPATGVFCLLAGTAWSAVQARISPVTNSDAPGSRPLPRVLAAAGLVLIATAFGVMPILAEAWYANGRPDLAVRVDPQQSQYHRALGESLIAQGSRSDGLAELRLAGRLGATDPGLYVELGDEELRAGDVQTARAYYRMALTIDPYWAPARQRLTAENGRATA